MMFHPVPIPGFFVLTSVTFAANMGGLAGANSNCLTNLTNTSWKGKNEAKLDASHVFAFLCDGSTCNNLLPNTPYQFAHAGDTTGGGTTFYTNSSGQGPGATGTWTGATYFNASFVYWTGRLPGADNTLWPTTSDAEHCTGWTVTSGQGMEAVASQTGTGRWGNTSMSCNSNYRLVCFVNP